MPTSVKKIFYPLTILGVSLVLYSCKEQKQTVFTSLPAAETNVQFTNKPTSGKLFNILYYLYYYNGGGTATGDINNDGLTDIYFTANNKSGNKLYLNKGNFVFEDITEKAGVAGSADWCSGVTMADVNADGFLDIYVSAVSGKYGLQGHNELFINDGKGGFKESAAIYKLDFAGLTTQTAFFDYDRDGDLDCYILNQSHHPHANIKDTSYRRKFDALSGDRLYRNDISTTGTFTDLSAEAGIYQSNLGYGLGLAIADINNDGWDDIYVGNDFHENDYYYVNNGNGTFSESGAAHFKHYSRFSMGNDVADYNNDGQLDVVTVDMLPDDERILKTYGSDENPDIYTLKLENNGYQKQYSRNCLQRNNGNGSSFTETALMSGISATDWSWSALFADFDNDGNKDLFVSSGIVKRPVDMDYIRFVSDLDMQKGRQQTDKYDDIAIKNMPDGSSHPYFFKGDGNFQFKNESANWGTGDMKGYYTGASYADLDNDGNLDVIVSAIDASALILKNNSAPKRHVTISLKGNNANTFGIGTKVWLFANNKMQYQQLMLTRGFQSSSDSKLHFGLDSLKYLDSVLIVWPDQKFQVLKNIPAVPTMTFSQQTAGGIFNHAEYFKKTAPVFEEVSTLAGANFFHAENDFLDYNKQYLIPHQQSTRGPKIAVADVNKDGLDDMYVCGATGQPGQMLIQTSAGKFVSIDTAMFAASKMCEDVDAIFFDANNDGFPDLYVVSGGNQFNDNLEELADQLYLNNGKGHFIKTTGSIPALRKNKSTVSAADFDKDGDIDLFVGGLADAKQFGIAQPSYLLLNDGKGIFTIAAPAIINLAKLGMVTSSAVADFNKDGWPDIVVAGEWMPVKIFINKNGKFTGTDLPASTGLWQTVYCTDLNGDGFTDILAGNWGHNSKLFAGKSGPLKLYVKDFDNNGSVEQVMAYTIAGKEYTFLAKDELERALPVLKKSYLTYGEVAGKDIQYMFFNLFKDYTELKAETLSSSCFMNDGKGGFVQTALPAELQLAPVFSFAPFSANENNGSFIAGGNFYGVTPYEGRYDGLQPTAFSFNKNSNALSKIASIPLLDGELRDAKWINAAGDKKILVLARNNSKLMFYHKTGN